MALDVKVTISVAEASGGIGFGNPLLLQFGVAENAVGYTECYNLADVMALGFDTEDDMYAAANMLFMQTNRPEKIAIYQSASAVDVAISEVVSKGWRQLVLVGEGTLESYIKAADFIETTKDKMLFVSVSYDEFAEGANLEGKQYDRTVILVNSTKNAAAALVGETAGRVAGSFTYKFKTLKNVVAENLTDTQINTLHENGAIGYVNKAGDDITTEGISQSGMYIDITDSIDYVVQNIEYRIQKLLNRSAKISYDDGGISLLEAEVSTALQDAYMNGIIATKADGITPAYSVSFAPRSKTTEADRASRVYKYGSFSFELAGAIHECIVNGEVTY